MKKLVLLLAVVFGVSLFSCNGTSTSSTEAAADTTATEVVAADTTAADSVDADTVAADSVK